MDNEYDEKGLIDLNEYDESELVFHEDGRITRKRFLIAGGGAVVGGAVGGPLIFSRAAEAMTLDASKLPYKANLNVKGSLSFWHFWNSPLRRGAIHQAILAFQKTYKHVKINDLGVPAGDIYNKLSAAVVAQSGVPDVIISDRLQLWHNATQLYTDLTPFYAKTPVSGKAYWPVTWQQVHHTVAKKSHIFGLPFETDIRVQFLNRAALNDAGISPNAYPKTWAQLKQYADKLDQKSGSSYKRIAVWPLDLGLDQLVWLNNGDWQNKSQHPTANSAANVNAADWIKSYIDRYGGYSAYTALNAQSSPGRDMFGSGLQAIHWDQPTYQAFSLVQPGVQFHGTKNPNLFPYWDVNYLPSATAKIKPWSFSGGFSISLPKKHARNAAHTEAAWEFAKYMSLVGQLIFERFAGNIPTVIAQTKDPALRQTPNWSHFIAALKYQHKLTNNKWDVGYPGDVVPDATTALEQGKSGKTALDAAQATALSNMKRNGGP